MIKCSDQKETALCQQKNQAVNKCNLYSSFKVQHTLVKKYNSIHLLPSPQSCPFFFFLTFPYSILIAERRSSPVTEETSLVIHPSKFLEMFFKRKTLSHFMFGPQARAQDSTVTLHQLPDAVKVDSLKAFSGLGVALDFTLSLLTRLTFGIDG